MIQATPIYIEIEEFSRTHQTMSQLELKFFAHIYFFKTRIPKGFVEFPNLSTFLEIFVLYILQFQIPKGFPELDLLLGWHFY